MKPSIKEGPTFESTDAVLAEARKAVVDAPVPTAEAAANDNAAHGAHTMKHAGHQTQAMTPKDALQNAGILYAKAAACFEGLYQHMMLEQMQGQSRS